MGCFQAWFKKGRIWVTKWKGGYHTRSCKTLLFESITHYNLNPYVKKSDLQSLCKTVVWDLLLQNAPRRDLAGGDHAQSSQITYLSNTTALVEQRGSPLA